MFRLSSHILIDFSSAFLRNTSCEHVETEQRKVPVFLRREANDKEHKFVASLLHSCHAYAIGCHRFTVQAAVMTGCRKPLRC